MVPYPSILTWEIQQTEESGRVQSMGSQRAGQDVVTKQQQQFPKEPIIMPWPMHGVKIMVTIYLN